MPRSRQGNRYALVLTSYHFGPGVSSVRGQYLAPVLRDDTYGGSHMLAISLDPSPFTAWYWQLALPLTFPCPPIRVWVYYALQGTLFQRLRTPWAFRRMVFPMTRALVGYRWRNIWLHPNCLVVTVTCATSCRKTVCITCLAVRTRNLDNKKFSVGSPQGGAQRPPGQG